MLYIYFRCSHRQTNTFSSKSQHAGDEEKEESQILTNNPAYEKRYLEIFYYIWKQRREIERTDAGAATFFK